MTMNDDLPSETRTERVVFWLIHGAVYLFVVALVGMVGALVMGLFDHEIRRWGWVAGASLAAIGYPVGWVSVPGFKPHKMSKAEQETDALRPRRMLSPLGGSLVGILMGLILGLLVWLVIVIFWVSLALSPLTPDDWREGFQTGLFVVYPPVWPALVILGCTMAAFCTLGIVLGLSGKIWSDQ